MVLGSSPFAVISPSDFVPASSKDFLDIQATTECGFTLKPIRDMTRTYNQLMKSFYILIFSFILPYFHKTFSKTDSSRLILESIKASEIKTSMVFSNNQNGIYLMFLLLFCKYWLIPFNSCSYYTIVQYFWRTCNACRNTSWKSKSRNRSTFSNCRS